VDQSNFINRLKNQILGIFNRNITERLKSAYSNDPIEFIGLFLTLIPMILLFLTMGLLILFVLFLNSSVSHLLLPYLFGILVLLMIFLFIGSMILSIRHRDDELESTSDNALKSLSLVKRIDKKSIFIVHGHDTDKKNEVVKYLRELKLNPIVLQDEPSCGKTIIEKVEHYVNLTSFVIVILTKDDYGLSKKDFDIDKISEHIEEINSYGLLAQLRLKSDVLDPLDTPPFIMVADLSDKMLKCIKPRARQNVIFELGLTIGHLHRNNVCVLYEDGVELPTDIHGLSYVSLKNEWKENLLKELIAAGIDCVNNR